MIPKQGLDFLLKSSLPLTVVGTPCVAHKHHARSPCPPATSNTDGNRGGLLASTLLPPPPRNVSRPKCSTRKAANAGPRGRFFLVRCRHLAADLCRPFRWATAGSTEAASTRARAVCMLLLA